MPRFHVVMADTATNEIGGYIARIDNAVDAICNHPWVSEIYKNTWIAKHVHSPDLDECVQNFLEKLGWMVLCVNLDEEIMNALNAGDSSVSLPTQQN